MTERIRAPELDGGLAWLNVDHPLSLRDLRGSVVILDFWTYCCVNCMHVLPTLRAIEERHASDPVVVIGVHSGKFSAEHDPERIREAVGRYDVRHPVVVDDNMTLWSRYAIRSWPTLVVVRPDGTIAAVAPGEPELEVLDAFVRRELELARAAGTLAAAPPDLGAKAPEAHSPLRYPGKAAPLPDGRIAISDSGHHRVLVVDGSGQVVATIGSGVRGLADGAFEACAFDDPQGTAWHEGALYIADTRNHVLRRADLETKLVTTVAGTGELGLAAPKVRTAAREVALRSPWDLASVGDAVYVAMAGSHQLYRYWPAAGEIEVYAGTGVEALIDGKVAQSAWAQPSGLSERGGTLYVADSETSAVRAVDLATGEVRTLIGEGLFDFGDEDGDASEAMLQHALGVAAVPGGVLIADTYNGKIKRLGDDGRVSTIASGLEEPGSVAVERGGAILVADTNAQRVVRVGPRGELVPIEVRGALEAKTGALPPRRREQAPAAAAAGGFTTLHELGEGVGLRPGGGEVVLILDAPEGSELSRGAPVRATLEVSRRSDLLVLARDRVALEADGGASQPIHIAVSIEELPEERVEAELVAAVEYVACDARNHAACFPGKVHARIPVRLLRAGGDRLELRLPLSPLEPA